jgi:hypothetical protein
MGLCRQIVDPVIAECSLCKQLFGRPKNDPQLASGFFRTSAQYGLSMSVTLISSPHTTLFLERKFSMGCPLRLMGHIAGMETDSSSHPLPRESWV